MSSVRFRVSVIALVGIATIGVALQGRFLRRIDAERDHSARHTADGSSRLPDKVKASSALRLPLTFEPIPTNIRTKSTPPQFVGYGSGIKIGLNGKGIEFFVPQRRGGPAVAATLQLGSDRLVWRGVSRIPGESNYFVGNDPATWRTHIPHFAQAETSEAGMHVVVYGTNAGLEYDLRLPPNADASRTRLRFSGAGSMQLDSRGDLVLRVGANELRMRRPHVYELSGAAPRGEGIAIKSALTGSYVLGHDGTIGFRISRHDPAKTLVIDPSISLAYSSFLGGAGTEVASGLAVDSAGKIYVGGTTTSPGTFPEASSTQLGPGTAYESGDPSDFFIAKLDPTQSGVNSLVYLTFLGGSSAQAGGLIAVDSKGDVALTGTTTSSDFPVTDQSKPTSGLTNGGNDTIVAEIDPTGAKLLYSTLFGGNGSQSTENAGGIVLDSTGNIFIASDTNSSNLPVTSNAYSQTYNSPTTDGFIAEFQTGATPGLAYCRYLGLDGEIGIGGLAIDSSENVYIAGFTSDPNADFPATNAIQSVYGGGAFDAFLMKISLRPASGVSPLGFATLLGGSGSDQALAVALDSQTPPSAYVTGTTSSSNFPTNGTVAAYQATLPGNATAQTSDAFLAVIAQHVSGTTYTPTLFYSTYLGGSQSDSGQGLAIAAPNAVYISGTANSWDFPWHDNFQPFNGYGDAFVAKLDPTSTNAASLIYATPLGGTSPAGAALGAQGTGIVNGSPGSIWVAGQTTSADFPTAGRPGNGFQQVCSSCQQSPAAKDAFVALIQESAAAQSALYFSGPSIPVNFGKQAVGSTTVPPQFAAINNSGEVPLTISHIGITGTNSADFSLSNAGSCISATLQPGTMCSFELNFVASTAGPEVAFVQVMSNAPGSPQVLEVFGEGTGVVALPAALIFGSQLANTSSAPQTVVLQNNTDSSALIIGIQQTGESADFPPAKISGVCAASETLPAGGSCPVSFTFAPTAAGSFQAQVDIQYQVQGLQPQDAAIPLSGVGLPAAPVASLQPGAVNFGSVAVGSTEQAQVVSLTNTGSAALDVTSITITGTNAGEFSLTSVGSSPCPVSSGSVAINAACTVGVGFAPKLTGAKSASLTFTDNADGSPQSIPLAGSAQSTAIQVAPESLTFSNESIGTKSAAQQITITNAGSSALGINSVTVAGSNPGDFNQTNNCPPSLAASGTCIVNVVFQPTVTGARSASISISDNAPNSPQTVSVTGTGSQAGVALSPSGPVNFSSQTAGTQSAPVSITVTDSGNGTLSMTKISFSGANAADFSETDTCNLSVSPSGTCTIKAVFQPQCGNNQAARTGTLVLTDNAPNSPQDVALTGTATGDMCLATASGGSTTASVSAGGSTTYTLAVSAASGYTGKVTIACSGAPQDATCSANPASVSVAGSTLVPFTVTVATTAPSAAARRALHTRIPRLGVPQSLGAWTVAFFLLLSLASAFKTTRALIRYRWIPLAIVFLAIGIGAAGCGGGDPSIVPTDPGTPPGTYTITVAGTASDGSSQSIHLTLVVD